MNARDVTDWSEAQVQRSSVARDIWYIVIPYDAAVNTDRVEWAWGIYATQEQAKAQLAEWKARRTE